MRQKILFTTKLVSFGLIIVMLLAIIFSINKPDYNYVDLVIKIIFPIFIINNFVRVLLIPINQDFANNPLFVERKIGYGWGINIHNTVGRYLVIAVLCLLFIAYIFTLF